jgi:hypothetical protein
MGEETIQKDATNLASQTIPIPNVDKSTREKTTRGENIRGDHDIPERVSRAAAELQSAMDAALLAGYFVEPSFTRIENRVTNCDVRIDSFVLTMHVYRGST